MTIQNVRIWPLISLLLWAETAYSERYEAVDEDIAAYYINQPFADATRAFQFRHKNRPYDSLKYSKNFKIKGWEVADGVYFGKAKIGGEYGPGFIFEQDGYSWGFNHQGVQLHIPLD